MPLASYAIGLPARAVVSYPSSTYLSLGTMPSEKLRGVVLEISTALGWGVIGVPEQGKSRTTSILHKTNICFRRSGVVGRDGYENLLRMHLDGRADVEFEVVELIEGLMEAINVQPLESGAAGGGCARRRPSQDPYMALAQHICRLPMTPEGCKKTGGDCGEASASPEIIDLVTPVKGGREQGGDSDFLCEHLDDLCIGESLSAEDRVSQRVREANARGDVIDLS